MIIRKTLKRKLSAMSVRKAELLYKSMSILQARRKFQETKHAFKYLLNLADQNARMIASLQLNNTTLVRALQKERENSALQLRDKLSVESSYSDLRNEYSILRVRLASISNGITNSMIPNLVRLSDDITSLKINFDGLETMVQSCTNEPNTAPKTYQKIGTTEKNPSIIANANILSQIVEECEEKAKSPQIITRKCKGGLRNIFNTSGRDRKISKNFNLVALNLENSIERTPVTEQKSESQSDPGTSRCNRNSPQIATLSTSLPASPLMLVTDLPTSSPMVLLRKVLTPVNSTRIENSDIVDVSFKEKSTSINTDAEITHISPITDQRQSSHFNLRLNEETISNNFNITERSKSKRYFFKEQDEDKRNSKNEESLQTNFSLDSEIHDQPKKRKTFKKSTSSRHSNRENEIPAESFHLIVTRRKSKKKSENIIHQDDEDNFDQNTSIPRKISLQKDSRDSSFRNDSCAENSFGETRRGLRSRKKNVIYTDIPLNKKLRRE